MTSIKKWFTLIEMLIVIVIIGILSVSLIPRVMGIQARARDTAREVDMRNIAVAIELYAIDNGEYPEPPASAHVLAHNKPIFVASARWFYTDKYIFLVQRINSNSGNSTPEECTGKMCSSIDENFGTVGSKEFQKSLKLYINSIPIDKGNGLTSQQQLLQLGGELNQAGEMDNPEGDMGDENDGGTIDRGTIDRGWCTQKGDYFAYSNNGDMFAITSIKESKKWNSDNCYGDKPETDSASMGLYQTLIQKNGKEMDPERIRDTDFAEEM